ncbi:MAG: type II secretion system protein N [Mariprofundus sp.]|nr:type II secretion system protein N [Mariprofundus sp.]
MKQIMHLSGNLPLLFELTLVAMLAWIVSGWLLPSDELKPFESSQNTRQATTTLPDITGLLTVPLFGKIQQIQSPKPVPKKPKPVVVSRLNIKLLGTIVAGENSAAIVAVAKRREQQVFFIGDRIQPGVILKEVEAEAIVVERSGKLERISLEQGAKLTSTPVPGAVFAASPGQASGQLTSVKLNRGRLQQQLQNFPVLMTQAKAARHFVNGKPKGFSITQIAPGSLYQQAGLQNGDIILSVNGKEITGAQQAMNMYQTLKNAAAIDLELIRAGQVRQIHYDIR